MSALKENGQELFFCVEFGERGSEDVESCLGSELPEAEMRGPRFGGGLLVVGGYPVRVVFTSWVSRHRRMGTVTSDPLCISCDFSVAATALVTLDTRHLTLRLSLLSSEFVESYNIHDMFDQNIY